MIGRFFVRCYHINFLYFSEQLVTKTISAIQKVGMKSLNYKYLLLSDCWMSQTRDKAGNLKVDADRFPSGIKALTDKVFKLSSSLFTVFMEIV